MLRLLCALALVTGLWGCASIQTMGEATGRLRSGGNAAKDSALRYMEKHRKELDSEAMRALVKVGRTNSYRADKALWVLGGSGDPKAGVLLLHLLEEIENKTAVIEALHRWLRVRNEPVPTEDRVRLTRERDLAAGCMPLGSAAHKSRNVRDFAGDAIDRFGDTVVITESDGRMLGEVFRCEDVVGKSIGEPTMEFGDTGAPPKPVASAPKPNSQPAADTPAFDVVHLEDGGRVRGTVVVDDKQGVEVMLPDKSTRKIPRKEIERVEYRE
jgi:hypothetical protein